ncbi:MAG: LysM peptidoglycan-binding domain-containing protein [Lunatimonas sp.]|uniref:LysM peptidoglycan-binding domain-containing protein n=1 Tax=Lunatimonas sp. TaxID=2060141 RepID=UPI00263BBA26|nr:LysM peptidoglycan-binding domain-containing protein [Lunatimonas sp.]MCC5939060.1 LysM peptidoglycan-binding domain-containing protein [Lunatimonas sp.]
MRKLRILYVLLVFLGSSLAWAQVPEVPSVIYFADMTLRLNEQAKREIQADVNALYRNPNYFQIKLDRVNLYMPIVERVLREQGVPDDMKYLVIQESSLISDAVSTSNAVGFWQFKKGTAEEVFMRVDNQVDERKNIVSSTRGAALYLKKHQGHLNNWATALVSYQMGLGGARGYFGDQYKGKRTMDIDRNSHWYLKKYLAHKIAFEGQTGKLVSNGDYLHEYPVKGPTTLAQLAKQLGVSENHLKEYNKWAATGNIPGDKTYVVTYIQKGIVPVRPAIQTDLPPAGTGQELAQSSNASAYPKVTGNTSKATQKGQVSVNGIKAVLAANSGPVEKLASQVDMKERKLRRLNDLGKSDPVVAGQYYYTKRKKGKAEAEEHVVQPGETLWKISQLHGIRVHSLKAKNRIYKDSDLKPGMVLKLQDYRKRGEEIQIVSPTRRIAPPTQASTHTADSGTATRTTPSGTSIQTVPWQSSGTPTPSAPAASAAQQVIEHVVEPGDTLYAISRKHQVSVDQLRQWNQIGEDNILKVGQKIVIRK